MTTTPVWKYAVRLDDPTTPGHLSRLLDHWGHGPSNFSVRVSAASSHSPAGLGNNNNTNNSSNNDDNNGNFSTAHGSGFRTPVASQYLIFHCADGPRYLVSHAVARMCDALADILDDLDVSEMNGGGGSGTGGADSLSESPANGKDVAVGSSSSARGGSPGIKTKQLVGETAEQLVDSLLEDCAVLEVAVGGQSLEAVLVYLSQALEHGAASVLPYPLASKATLAPLLQGWELDFLNDYAPHLLPNGGVERLNSNSNGSSSAAAAANNNTANSGGTPGTKAAAASPSSTVDVGTPSQQRKNSPANNNNAAAAPFSAPDFQRGAVSGGGGSNTGAAVAASTNNSPSTSTLCPPLLALLRASDYLGINSLRDLTCASLASRLLSTRDETQLAAMLGLSRLPKEAELEDVYSRFPFLQPTRRLPSSTAPTSP